MVHRFPTNDSVMRRSACSRGGRDIRFMRTLILLSALVGAIGNVQARPQPLRPAQLTGSWVGTGTFFDRALQERAGPIPISLVVDSRRSGMGRVGGATLDGIEVRERADHLEIAAKLTGDIGVAELESKEYLVFVVTAVNDSTARAEFHLKSNRVFDFRMREGQVTLKRQ